MFSRKRKRDWWTHSSLLVGEHFELQITDSTIFGTSIFWNWELASAFCVCKPLLCLIFWKDHKYNPISKRDWRFLTAGCDARGSHQGEQDICCFLFEVGGGGLRAIFCCRSPPPTPQHCFTGLSYCSASLFFSVSPGLPTIWTLAAVIWLYVGKDLGVSSIEAPVPPADSVEAETQKTHLPLAFLNCFS